MKLFIGVQESVICKKTPIIITEDRASLFVCLFLLFQIKKAYIIRDYVKT